MTGSTVGAAWLDVERRMLRGERFADVEDVINASDVSTDQKSVLRAVAVELRPPQSAAARGQHRLSRTTGVTPPQTISSRRHLSASPYDGWHVEASSRVAPGGQRSAPAGST